MVDPEGNTPGAQAVGPVAAGPMAAPPEPAVQRVGFVNVVVGADTTDWHIAGGGGGVIDATGFGQHVTVEFDRAGRAHYRLTPPAPRPDPTPEELEAQRLQVEEHRRADEERRARREAAEARSKELFLHLLTDDQRRSFDETGCIGVTTKSGRTYSIDCRHGYSGNIYWLGGEHGDTDDVRGSFCIYPNYRGPHTEAQTWITRDRLPRYDAFLGQLLLLMTNEDLFLDIGIFSGPVHPVRGRMRWDW